MCGGSGAPSYTPEERVLPSLAMDKTERKPIEYKPFVPKKTGYTVRSLLNLDG